MRTDVTALEGRAAAVTPPIVCNHPDDVAEVKALDSYRIEVHFHDGTNGITDLSSLIHSPRPGVFAALRDLSCFNAVTVPYGAVTWPGEIDVAPDAMYAAIQAHGDWKL